MSSAALLVIGNEILSGKVRDTNSPFLAVELRKSPVRVYAVCPGFVDTEITRQGAAQVAELGRHTADEVLAMYAKMNACGRLLQPAEVADVVGQLADPASDIPSGSIYQMDDMPPSIVT